jgi:hypothetical protein
MYDAFASADIAPKIFALAQGVKNGSGALYDF